MAENNRLVTLENLEPRLACYNLDHNHAIARTFPRVTVLPSGQSHGHFVEKKLPDSVTFLAREVRTLPASVLGCPEIASALKPSLHGVKPRLRQRGDVIEHTAEAAAPSRSASAPNEVVDAAAKKSRDVARSVLGSKATVSADKGQG